MPQAVVAGPNGVATIGLELRPIILGLIVGGAIARTATTGNKSPVAGGHTSDRRASALLQRPSPEVSACSLSGEAVEKAIATGALQIRLAASAIGTARRMRGVPGFSRRSIVA